MVKVAAELNRIPIMWPLIVVTPCDFFSLPEVLPRESVYPLSVVTLKPIGSSYSEF